MFSKMTKNDVDKGALSIEMLYIQTFLKKVKSLDYLILNSFNEFKLKQEVG